MTTPNQKFRSQPDLTLVAFRISDEDRDLWRVAAKREQITLSEFLRRAIRQRARGVIALIQQEKGEL